MDNNLLIYPELIGPALKNREIHLFVCWCILKQERRNIHDKKLQNGLWLKSDILSTIQRIFSLNKTQTYAWYDAGINKYWTKASGKKGEQKLGLLSLANIIKKLSLEVYKVSPYLVPIDKFESINKIIKYKNDKEVIITPQMQITSLMLGLYISRHNDLRPMPLEAIASEIGYSVRTIQRMLRCTNILVKRQNYQIIAQSISPTKILDKLRDYQKSGIIVRPYKNNNEYFLVKQIANSYSIPELERLPIKNRSKYLKKADDFTDINFNLKKYHSEISEVGINSSNDALVQVKEIGISGVTFWKPHQYNIPLNL